MERVSLKSLSKEEKIFLLNELGFNSDGQFVLDSSGNRFKDKYVKCDITLDNMLILPGSTIILDNNEISILRYIEEYGYDI